jgi:hypothetical protein
MYLYQTVTGTDLRWAATQPPPFGPGLAADHVQDAVALEIWASRCSEAGPDTCEFRLVGPTGVVRASQRIPGY